MIIIKTPQNSIVKTLEAPMLNPKLSLRKRLSPETFRLRGPYSSCLYYIYIYIYIVFFWGGGP